jgi:hypothetical protein
MSIEATNWAIDRKGLPPSAKLLLLVAANSADRAGVAFPGRKMLAERCCFSERTASTQIELLERLGEILRLPRRRQNGSKTSNWLVLAPYTDRRPMLDANPKSYPPEVVSAATSGATSSRADPSRANSSRADHDIAHVQSVQGSGEAGVKTRSVSESSVDPSDTHSAREQEALELCNFLVDELAKDGGRRPTITPAWQTAARQLLVDDDIPADTIRKVILWTREDEFWCSRIPSMVKLAEHWNLIWSKAKDALQTESTADWINGLNARATGAAT